MAQQTRKYRFEFRGYNLIPVAGSNAGTPWVKTDTSSGGSPTVQGLAGGGVRLLMDNTNEIQNLCLSFGDLLAFDIDELISFEAIVKVNAATLDSATQVAWGLTGNRADAIDSIAQAALFRIIGDNNVVCESDDGTNDNDDKSTGLTQGTDWKRYLINFAERITTQEPPSLSLGGKSNVSFYMGNSRGALRRVAESTRFDMSNYAGSLQPFFQIQKTADTNTDALDVLECCVEVKLPDYS